MNFTLAIIALTAFFLVSIIALVNLLYGLRYGAMYMKIPYRTLQKVLQMVPVKGKIVYDLGAGYGHYTHDAFLYGHAAKIYAVEIDPFKVFKLKCMYGHLTEIEIVKKNLLTVDLSKADVVYCYLFGPLMQQVGLKAQKEMPPGSTLVSVEHSINHLTPAIVDEEHKIYVYKF